MLWRFQTRKYQNAHQGTAFLTEVLLLKETFYEHGDTLTQTTCQMLLYFILSKASETTQTLVNIWLFKTVIFTVCEIVTVFKISRDKILSHISLL